MQQITASRSKVKSPQPEGVGKYDYLDRSKFLRIWHHEPDQGPFELCLSVKWIFQRARMPASFLIEHAIRHGFLVAIGDGARTIAFRTTSGFDVLPVPTIRHSECLGCA